jgi:hypothetical protein
MLKSFYGTKILHQKNYTILQKDDKSFVLD